MNCFLSLSLQLFFFYFLSVTNSAPIITPGITFGSPLFTYRPLGTPVYYDRPYDHYYPDSYYYDGFSSHTHGYYSQQPYEYIGSDFGGLYASLGGYSPIII